jgi:hypothetical protein
MEARNGFFMTPRISNCSEKQIPKKMTARKAKADPSLRSG